MGENTKIEWARHTFNPWYGCTKVSPACDFCYAEAWAKRSGLVEWGPHAPRRRSSPANWKEPLKWDKAARAAGERHSVFGPSLGDPFDNQVDPAWRRDYFDLIRTTPNLIYLLLTKRPQNIIKMVDEIGLLPDNVALGTTVEDQARANLNVPALMHAKVNLQPLFIFLSCEPLLGEIDLGAVEFTFKSGYFGGALRWHHRPYGDDYLEYPAVDWVICGGESGPHARPMHPAWARSLRDQCAAAGVPFFFKQWGQWVAELQSPEDIVLPVSSICPWAKRDVDGAWSLGDQTQVWNVGKKAAGTLLDGRRHRAFPRQLSG